ncbi:polysaccharide deacetylase [Paenibacillus antri]|uniref:Polysaccharide deacetylase n=2 Tax=Paenibacillus antri TaxID=2582848 RepID=A0A5R9G4Q0_9BACL|nr:polysaccharide deacetylase [Paenibacillus antri]
MPEAPAARTAEPAKQAAPARPEHEPQPKTASEPTTSEPAAEPAAEPAVEATDEPTVEPTVPVSLPTAWVDPAELFARLASGDRTGGATRDEAASPEGPSQPTVYLTFDDGPSKWTPQVLDVLKEYGVPATFFVLGEQAEAREETIRRIVREGHALGNHTYDHKYEDLYGSFASFWEQAERTNDILENITGERVSLLRAPGGTAKNFDAFYFYYLEKAGYKIHDWNVDSGDSKRRGVPASEIVANVKRTKLAHEMNVLLHDGAGHEESAKALPDIIEYFREQGYRFAALTEETKPISFKVTKPKWSRAVSEAEHARLLALVEPSRDVAILSAASEERVPLRAWAEETGATVVWDAVRETATVVVGQNRLHWNVREAAGWTTDAEGRVERIDFALELQGERLYAPKASLESLR